MRESNIADQSEMASPADNDKKKNREVTLCNVDYDDNGNMVTQTAKITIDGDMTLKDCFEQAFDNDSNHTHKKHKTKKKKREREFFVELKANSEDEVRALLSGKKGAKLLPLLKVGEDGCIKVIEGSP